jgi:hypothetical protein
MNDVEQKILGLVTERQHVSFVEIKRLLGEDSRGEIWLSLPKHPNIILWPNISQAMADTIISLINAGRLYVHPASVLVYFVDGESLNLPLARQARQYKKPHWLPVVFCTFPPNQRRQHAMPRNIRMREGKEVNKDG